MSTIQTRDGTQIHDKYLGSGQPVVFSRDWQLNADAREDQMLFLSARGFHCIVPDRRVHRRASQPWGMATTWM